MIKDTSRKVKGFKDEFIISFIELFLLEKQSLMFHDVDGSVKLGNAFFKLFSSGGTE